MRPKVKLLCQRLYLQILEAGFKEPLGEKKVGNYLDSLLISGAEPLPGHLVEALAELSDSERDGRDVCKHLLTDGVHDIQ